MIRWTWEIDLDPQGERLDKFVVRALELGKGEWSNGTAEPLTRTRIQALIEEGALRVDEVPANSRKKVERGSTLLLELPPARSLELIPEERRLDILFEDEHLIVLNKPPQLTVHPSSTQLDGTLVHALLHHAQDWSGIGGVLRPGIVHRIDKNTSGALVVSKSDAAHQGLTELFARHAIERRYWALVYGTPKIPGKSPLRIESLIGRNPNDRVKMSMTVKTGKKAITHLKMLEAYGFASFVEAQLETGRTHQVRVHLAGIGHSLLGDPTYGLPSKQAAKWKALPKAVQERTLALPGQALHARVLGFVHPLTGQPLRFEAEPPAEFSALLAELKKYA